MNPERALFEAILANPDDITPRLVYADWCDEQGNPRGEFIRIQCELAEYEGPPVKVRHLKQREAELLKDYRRAWNGEIHRRLAETPLANKVDNRHGLIRRWEYQRGFVEYAVVEASAILDFPDAVFQIGPLRRLRVLRAENCINDVMRSPYLKHLQTVEVNLPNSTYEAAARHLSRLTRSGPASTQDVSTQTRPPSQAVGHHASFPQIIPVQCRPTPPRGTGHQAYTVLDSKWFDDLMPALIVLGALMIGVSLCAAISLLLVRAVEILFEKTNLGQLFW